MKLLYFIRDPYPTTRPDVLALIGRCLAARGIGTDLVATRQGPVTEAPDQWPAGEAFIHAPGRSAPARHAGALRHDLRRLARASAYDALLVRDKILTAALALLWPHGRPVLYWASYPFPEDDRARAAMPGLGRAHRLVLRLRAACSGWLLYRFVIPRARLVFVQSERMAEQFAQRTGRRSGLVPVPMGVDETELPAPLAALAGPGVDEPLRLVYLGALDRVRRLDFLLEVLDELRRRDAAQPCRLTLVGSAGSPADREWLMQRVHEAGLQDRVSIIDAMPRAQAWALARRCHVGVSAIPRGPVYDVSSPTKTVEYLAIGLPALVNDIADQQSLIEATGAGVCAPMAAGAFADAILAIRRDYPALAARAAAARGWLLAHRGYEGLADTVAAAIRTVVTPRCPDRPRAGVDPTLAADVAPDITPDAAPDARPDARPAPSIPMRTVLLLGPHLEAVSGISTHLRLLIGSPVGRHFRVRHFQVGSEGRTASRPQATGRGLTEGAFARLWRLAVSPWQLAAVLLRERPAIVHLNTAMDAKAFGRDLAYLLVACALRRRTVFQVHGGALPAEFTRGNPVLAALLRLAMRLPDQVVLLGRVERDAWQRFMPALSTRVIANAVETGESGEPVRSASSSYAQLRLVYLGRIVEAKGLFEALDAVCALHAHGLQPHFTIAGSGPDEARLREHAARLGIAAQVSFPGPVFGDAKARLWQQADVLVFPTWREGLPYSLLEAMAAGVVAITTPVGAIPEVITHGRDGLLVPPRDPVALAAAIRRVHDDRPAALAIAQAARRRVREAYSVERLATDFFGVYSRL